MKIQVPILKFCGFFPDGGNRAVRRERQERLRSRNVRTERKTAGGAKSRGSANLCRTSRTGQTGRTAKLLLKTVVFGLLCKIYAIKFGETEIVVVTLLRKIYATSFHCIFFNSRWFLKWEIWLNISVLGCCCKIAKKLQGCRKRGWRNDGRNFAAWQQKRIINFINL